MHGMKPGISNPCHLQKIKRWQLICRLALLVHLHWYGICITGAIMIVVR